MNRRADQSLRGRSHGRSAFTLIEMLIVIAILGMLIGLLLPSLTRAREQARDTQCLNRLRSLFIAHTTYLHDYKRFPPLNNDEDDGAWQYNYLIYDGRDFDENFGPLINDGSNLDEIRVLYCPVQKDPSHSLGTVMNPWPVIPTLDTRAGYGRRYHFSGKSLSDLKHTRAFAADLIHLPEVIKTAHKTGVNAVYTDGHAQWVRGNKKMLDNDLASPFDVLNNEIINDIWDIMDEAQ